VFRDGQSTFEPKFDPQELASLGHIQLRKLARENKLDMKGGADALRERLLKLPREEGADTKSSTASSSNAVYTESHLNSLGQIQLRKLAKKHGIDTKGGPAALRSRLSQLKSDVKAKRAPSSSPSSQTKKPLSVAARRQQRETDLLRKSIYGDGSYLSSLALSLFQLILPPGNCNR